MGQISKEGAGCFWTFWGICGIGVGIQLITESKDLDGGTIIVGLSIIALSILFIKYAGKAMWK